jgi:nucleotidyltransferase/DNA polymerase involved in DNA repair
MPSRQIICVDLDAFFCSVEELLDPSLKGKPIIVGADPRGRGVVSSASYAAREYGVRSAMPISRAARLCPHAIFLPVRRGVYGEYSHKVMSVLAEYTPLFEPVSIDEAFLDVTLSQDLFGSAEHIGKEIQRRIHQDIGLPVSLGIATNKLVAKIASDLGKPNGFVQVPSGTEAAFLAPLPVEKLWGVGLKTAQRLHDLGFHTIGDLAQAPVDKLQREFGVNGLALHQHALGIDDSPVKPGGPPKSVSQEHTFPQDVSAEAEIGRHLLHLSQGVAHQLRSQGFQARTLVLKLRYHNFTTITRSITLEAPTDLDHKIFDSALGLFRKHWRQGDKIRLVGVGVHNLVPETAYQLGLFGPGEERYGRLHRTVDAIRQKYGDDIIVPAVLVRTGERSRPKGKRDSGASRPPEA